MKAEHPLDHRNHSPVNSLVNNLFWSVLTCVVWLMSGTAAAYLDLSTARVEKLVNGLTVIVLEDRSMPVVSVQMLYKSGARNEPAGKTGLAHFLEHMAFRASENFPDTRLVSDIYAVGGEWHGYTWLDQTTYFATVPVTEFELLLQIEADRMARLKISAADVESERGAVLTEMHSYENDPATVLQDYVLYLSFLTHPYRNNTIGWESDINSVSHRDVVEFYKRHYQPGNAVLTIVGDVRTDEALQRVRHHFSKLPADKSAEMPHTVEPLQTGVRRIRLQGEVERKNFKIAYRAPSVNNPDFASFLLAQELLSAGSGVNFLQNDWGSPTRPGSPLDGISGDLTTWFPPSAQDYVYTISGSIPAESDESFAEAAIEKGIESLRLQFKTINDRSKSALSQAKHNVQRALIFDVQTTEDAAHQLAFFTGLNALGVLIELPETLERVTVTDISRVLDQYLSRKRRTIGWYIPTTERSTDNNRLTPSASGPLEEWSGNRSSVNVLHENAASPLVKQLSNGTVVIMQRSLLSRTAMLKLIVPSADFKLPAGVSMGKPARGLSSLDFEFLPDELDQTIKQARQLVDSAVPMTRLDPGDAIDPESLLEYSIENLLGLHGVPGKPDTPLLLVATGDIDPDSLLHKLEQSFSTLPTATWVTPPRVELQAPAEVEKNVKFPIAQEHLGYVVLVPGQSGQTTLAWQMALYILSHGYEGRLGKEAISRRGLIYYIDTDYHTDGNNDWITLSMGVDADKLIPMKTLLREEMTRLLSEPPSEQEIEEARTHFLGRDISAAQSNQELTAVLTNQWLLYGNLTDHAGLKQQLDDISRKDIIELIPAFTSGSIISIRNPHTKAETAPTR